LSYQNEEKAKTLQTELVVANKELVLFQTREKKACFRINTGKEKAEL